MKDAKSLRRPSSQTLQMVTEIKPAQHDDSEGRNVVPDDHSIEEIWGVVFDQNEDRMFVKRREGTVYKAPSGPPHSGEEKE